MVLILRLLLLSLLWLPLKSNAQSDSCYCTSSWRADATFGSVCTANATCWACAPGAYNPSWQQSFCSGYQAPPPVVNIETQILSCQSGYSGSITQTRTISNGVPGAWVTSSDTCQALVTTETQTLSCPVNFSGGITQTRTITAGIAGYWVTVSNSCVQNPPTCFVGTQSQSLACQQGYVGLITQVKTSLCPDPYGSPVWGAWITSTDTCVKSLSNPTNVASPVSPVSPMNPTSVLTTPPPPVVVQPPAATPTGEGVPSPVSSVPTVTAPMSASTPTVTGSSTSTQGSAPAPKGKFMVPGLGAVLALDIFVKPGIKQPDLFVAIDLSQEIPKNMLTHQLIMMEMLHQELPNQNQKLKEIQDNTMEIQQ